MVKTLTSLYPSVSNPVDQSEPANAAGEKLAYIVTMPAAGDLQAFAGYYGGGTGSRSASAECYSVSGGIPNADLGSSYDEGSFSPASFSVDVATLDNALTVALSDQIAFVLTNLNGTPASNYFSLSSNPAAFGGYSYHYDGTAWRFLGGTPINVKISNNWYGTKVGARRVRNNLSSQPLYNDTGSPNTIRRAGIIFKPSANCNLCEATFWFTKSGTVTGDWLKAEVWSGSTLVATSSTKVASDLVTATTGTSGQPFNFLFGEQALAAGTEYRIAVRLDGAGALDSSNYIMLVGSDGYSSTFWPSDANVTDGYLGGTYSTVETPTSGDWTDYRAASTVVLPSVQLNGYLQTASGGIVLIED